MTDVNVQVTVPPAVNVRITAGGPQGPQGIQGIPGSSAGGSFYHEFLKPVAAAEWVVNHGLGKYPNVEVIDEDGQVLWGVEVEHLSLNEYVLRFDVPVAGRAISS